MTKTLERLINVRDGETLDEFVIEKTLGRGLSKSATTYKAADQSVVVKLYTADINKSAASQIRYQKFKNEPALLMLLKKSKYVVDPVTDFREHSTHQGEKKLSPYYAMEHMDGSIDTLLVNKDISLKDRLEIAVQVIEGLKDCHSKNICHRDLYSPNVLYKKDGEKFVCKIADFGSGKQLGQAQLTPYYAPTGNITITSPEAIAGLLGGDKVELAIIAAADIFSAGLMLYEIFTGLQQERMNRTLFGYRTVAAQQDMYKETTSEEERLNFLKTILIPGLNRVKIEQITTSDILDDEKLAQNLMELISSMIQVDYNKRETDLNKIISSLQKIAEVIS